MTFLLVAFRGFFFCGLIFFEKQCLGLCCYFLLCGSHFGQILDVLALEKSSDMFVDEKPKTQCVSQCAVIFEIITILIQKHFKTVTVTVILENEIQMTFKTAIGNQWR